jgi:nucleoside-diphosphate-sugar epimerase
MSKILVTGGSGFIGSALVKSLVAAGNRARARRQFAREPPPAEGRGEENRLHGRRDSRPPLRARCKTWTRCTISPSSTAPSSSIRSRTSLLDVGVRGVLDACQKHNVGTLVLASSSRVYQLPPYIPAAEDAPAQI